MNSGKLKILVRIGNKEVYPPSEDSFLLAKYVRKFVKGFVLDMGTGSGIQAIIAGKKRKVRKVYAVDIDPDAVFIAKQNVELNSVKDKVTVFESNLFSNIPRKKFDFIIFNPPYLPPEGNEDYKTILWTIGGSNGYETIRKFLKKAKYYLKERGKILLVFSSLTNEEKIKEIFRRYLYKYRLLDKKRFFFETLYLYELWKK